MILHSRLKIFLQVVISGGFLHILHHRADQRNCMIVAFRYSYHRKILPVKPGRFDQLCRKNLQLAILHFTDSNHKPGPRASPRRDAHDCLMSVLRYIAAYIKFVPDLHTNTSNPSLWHSLRNIYGCPTNYICADPDTPHRPFPESASHSESAADDTLHDTYRIRNPQNTLPVVVCYSNFHPS